MSAAPQSETKSAHADMILQEVSRDYRVSIADIKSDKRNVEAVAARHEAMLRMSKDASMTSAAIGLACGGKDPSTVRYALKKLKGVRSRDTKGQFKQIGEIGEVKRLLDGVRIKAGGET